MNRPLGTLATAVAALCLAGSACSSGGGGGSATGTGGKDAGAAGSGGTAGGGGSAGGGSAGSAGGAAGSSSGGASGGGGSGGAAGSAGHDGGAAGSGGAGDGGPADGSADGAGAGIAAALDKFRFDCPCKTGAGDHTSNDNCNVTPETDRQTFKKTIGGDPGTTYNVTLRVRGLTEPNTYTGGTLDASNMRFYTGGTTSTPGYTSYMMTVANPAQHFFFNYNPTTSHIHFLLDYTITVKMRGGTMLTLDVDGDGSQVDGHQVANFDHLVVPGVPPAPDWYDGQFVQLDVVSAEPAQ